MLCLRTKQDHGFVMYLLSAIFLHCLSLTHGKTYINQFAVQVKGGRYGLDKVLRSTGLISKGQIGDLEDYYLLEIPNRHRRSTSHSQEHHETLSAHPHVEWFEQQVHRPRFKRDVVPNPYADVLNDKLYNDQWYLHGGGYGNYDMNVIPAWKKGYTGRNVVVSILDDGIERNHPDLQQNYDPFASYDVNDHDNDPMPRYDPSNENRHGTRCAGEVSAVANNTVCGVGIAPNSKIGGVRMLDGEVYDAVEAASLSFNRSHIDIYSASWGPDDDGRVVDGPGPLAKKAFIDGITQGRQGKGSIYVWASGNGGNAQDSCNCDGYTNSIYTLSISSTSEHGQKPWYLEECSSTLATTYSSGAYPEKQIVTVDLRGTCTEGHTGTSASAPLAAGVVALVLEANPSLTWRDVQYITMMTSNPDPMVDGQWTTNSLGRKVSLRYGYGLMDAAAMVDLAEVWTNIPQQHICEVHSPSTNVKLDGSKYINKLETQACAGLSNSVKYLEHVQVTISLVHKRRGDVILWITSPRGTRSKLLPRRPNDRQQGEFKDWPFLSVHFWGEDPTGSWTLEIDDARSYNPHGATGGVLRSWSIVLHGTATQPINLTNQTAESPSTTAAPLSPHNTTTTSSHGPIVCHVECEGGCTGTGASDCNACKNVQIVGSGECAEVCPDGYYQTETNLCQTCDSTCKTCSGPTLSECLSCPPGSYYTEKHHICIKQCLKGYYRVTDRPIPKKATTPLRNDIRCTQTSIEVFIPVEYAKTEFYVLRDPSCGTTNNGTHLLIKFNLGECGTQLEFKEDSLVFSNQLEEGSDSNEVISIQCEYPRHHNVSLYNISVTSASKIFIYEKGRGVGFMTIRQFTSGDFAEPFAPSMEQTTFKPGDLVYIEMGVEGAFSDAADVGLIADSCTVDPMSRGGGKGILLVENNCPKAAGVKIYETEKQFFHFHFPAPDFNITGRVQVNCRVSACNKMLDCSTNCNRKRRSIRSSSDSLLLTSEPIFVKTTSGKYVSKEAIATSCLSVLSLVLIIAVVILVKDRRKFNNRALVLENEIHQ